MSQKQSLSAVRSTTFALILGITASIRQTVSSDTGSLSDSTPKGKPTFLIDYFFRGAGFETSSLG